jgi:hypothetical protein
MKNNSKGRILSACKAAYEFWLQDYMMQGKLIRREHDFEREIDNQINDRKRGYRNEDR